MLVARTVMGNKTDTLPSLYMKFIILVKETTFNYDHSNHLNKFDDEKVQALSKHGTGGPRLGWEGKQGVSR